VVILDTQGSVGASVEGRELENAIVFQALPGTLTASDSSSTLRSIFNTKVLPTAQDA
jgi:hypothetical protein